MTTSRPGAPAVSPGLRLHKGRTALHQAALTGDCEVSAALLGAGADRTVVDREHGTTALEWALWARREAAAELLRDPPHYGGAHDDQRPPDIATGPGRHGTTRTASGW